MYAAKTTRSRRAIVAIASATMIAATAGAGTAQAASFTRDTATCPAGSVVAGGGMQVVGEGTADFHTSIQETTPGTIGGGAQSLWLVAARNDGTAPHTFGLFAVCQRKPNGYQVVSRDFAVAPGGFLRDTATCPKGKVVIGGGAAVIREGTRDFRTQIQESAPSTIGGGAQSLWVVALRNNDAAAHTIRISAVCAPKPRGYVVVRRDFTVPANGFVRDTARCPKGTVVYAGGAQVAGEGTSDFRTRMQETAPGTIGGGATSLWLNAVKNTDAKSHKIAMRAVCAERVTSYKVVRRDLKVA